jgi:hypothetical protein
LEWNDARAKLVPGVAGVIPLAFVSPPPQKNYKTRISPRHCHGELRR